MRFLLKAMGWVAKQSHLMSRHLDKGVPQNLGVVLGCAVISVLLYALYSFDGTWWALLGCVVLALISLVFAVSMGLQDTIFIPEALPHTVDVRDNVLLTKMHWTGRMQLNPKEKRRFMYVPARATRLGDGSIGISANIDASTKVYGFTWTSRVGTWWSVPKLDSLQIEAGQHFFGFEGYPALRLRFIEKADQKNSVVIIAFNTTESRTNFYSLLVTEKNKFAL